MGGESGESNSSVGTLMEHGRPIPGYERFVAETQAEASRVQKQRREGVVVVLKEKCRVLIFMVHHRHSWRHFADI